MIIKSCYIESFGKLSGQSFNFLPGLNVIKRENGWGKTTMAYFIKAMFYGQKYTRKHSIDENIRKKYTPWQGGNYGGNLIFEIDDKTYRIERFFGKREKDDSFKLYDLDTNMLSEDYSENIGEEIFGIDVDSFARSILITLDGKKPTMQDNINAKLNDLIDNTDDVNNYEVACKYLEDVAKKIKPLRGQSIGTKKYASVSNRLDIVKDEIKKCDNAREQMLYLEKNMEELKNNRKETEIKINLVRKDIGNKVLSLKKEGYNRITSAKEDKKVQLDKLMLDFNNKIPDSNDLEVYREKARKLQSLINKIEKIDNIEENKIKVKELEAMFDGEIPTVDEINTCEENLIEHDKLRVELNNGKPTSHELEEYGLLDMKYSGKDFRSLDLDSLMKDYENVGKLKSEIKTEIIKRDMLEKMEQKGNSSNREVTLISKYKVPFYLIGGILIILGLLLFIAKNIAPGIFSLVLGVAIFAITFFLVGDKKPEQMLTDTDNKEEIIMIDERILKIKEDAKEIEDKYLKTIKNIDPVADISNVPKVLSDMKAEIQKYETLSYKINKYNEVTIQLNKKIISYQDKIHEFLSKYKTRIETTDDKVLIKAIENKRSEYYELKDIVDDYSSIFNESMELKSDVENYITKYRRDFRGEKVDYTKIVEAIRDDYRDYINKSEELNLLEKEMEDFKKENDLTQLQNVKIIDETVDELRELENKYEAEKEEIIKGYVGYEKKWNEFSLIEEKKQDFQSEEKKLNEELVYLDYKHNHLQDTIEFLTQAKELLSTKYMYTMKDAFKRYIGIMDNKSLPLSIDLKLNNKIENGGKQWESAYLSSGYKDLVNISTRLALIEAMYEDEKPFIILDDPFINLDDDKLHNGKALIEKLAKQNQVIYLVCQESRVIEA